jgi:dolichol-phosphate mannosyltransferase
MRLQQIINAEGAARKRFSYRIIPNFTVSMQPALVIIPTYNELENIQRMIVKVMSLADNFHLLVVDDGSPDGTGEVVRNAMDTYPGRLFLEVRKGKQGLGTAYIHGFEWGIQKGYDFIFEMDCDFSHNPEDLTRLYHACKDEHCDVAIGSRYVNGVVNVVNWPMSRVLMSYFASVYVRFITGMKIMDTTAGFKCYRRNALEKILQTPVKFVGYAFQIEMKFRAVKYGFKVQEVPIIFTDRTAGSSKMNGNIIREAFFGVMWLTISSWFRSWK